MSFDHTPSSKDEKDRIKAAGGLVVQGRLNGVLAVSRSFGDAPHKDVEEQGQLISTPDVRVDGIREPDEFILIGNVVRAHTHIPRTQRAHTQHHLVSDLWLSIYESDKLFWLCAFRCAACDGLWDVLTSEQAVNFVRRKLVMHKVRKSEQVDASIDPMCSIPYLLSFHYSFIIRYSSFGAVSILCSFLMVAPLTSRLSLSCASP
jgi:serine/threonine protein phosphatase PrpC